MLPIRIQSDAMTGCGPATVDGGRTPNSQDANDDDDSTTIHFQDTMAGHWSLRYSQIQETENVGPDSSSAVQRRP